MELVVVAFQTIPLKFFNIVKFDISHLILNLLAFISLFLLLFVCTPILHIFIIFKLFLKVLFIEWFLTNDAAFLLFCTFFIILIRIFLLIKLLQNVVKICKIRLQAQLELIKALWDDLASEVLDDFTEIVYYLVEILIAGLMMLLWVAGLVVWLHLGQLILQPLRLFTINNFLQSL